MSESSPNPIRENDPNPIRDAIAEAIAEHETILFMKGTPEAPACGFSARTVAVLQGVQAKFAAVDVLPDPRIRQELTAISSWPTIPQLFYRGELIGGCDIVCEMYKTGELAETLGLPEREPTEPQEDPQMEPDMQPHMQPVSSAAQGNGFTPIENRLG